MFYFTCAGAHINIHNTVHKNNADISLEVHLFPVPQNHSSVHPHNTDHETASVVGRGGGGRSKKKKDHIHKEHVSILGSKWSPALCSEARSKLSKCTTTPPTQSQEDQSSEMDMDIHI